MERLRVLAYAKLNLVLKVVGRRADGYHLLQTLMCAVDLADEITLIAREEGLHLVAPPELGPPEANLSLRAARALAEATGAEKGAEIVLEKRVPAGAGLGGGSSDAAAVLAGLNELWNLNLLPKELREIGARLGADVPFFLFESPAWAEGIGERLSPAKVSLPEAFLILVPPFFCPTPEVYRAFDELKLPSSCPLRPTGELLFENDLWPAAVRVRPGLARLRKALEGVPSLGVGMTGSGSALFAAFPGPKEAKAAARALEGKVQGKLFVAAPVPRGYKFVG